MSVERDRYTRHVPFCETRVAVVDQYLWPEKDTTDRTCFNGTSIPIYTCGGQISRTLPLHMYPKVDRVHPTIAPSFQPHFGSRDPFMRNLIESDQLDIAKGRLEGLYAENGELNPYDMPFSKPYYRPTEIKFS